MYDNYCYQNSFKKSTTMVLWTIKSLVMAVKVLLHCKTKDIARKIEVVTKAILSILLRCFFIKLVSWELEGIWLVRSSANRWCGQLCCKPKLQWRHSQQALLDWIIEAAHVNCQGMCKVYNYCLA